MASPNESRRRAKGNPAGECGASASGLDGVGSGFDVAASGLDGAASGFDVAASGLDVAARGFWVKGALMDDVLTNMSDTSSLETEGADRV
ncbi:MAG: hypothetical protein R3B13_15260 [Polyangiaceae bacterium]